jgi:hypothetical protein
MSFVKGENQLKNKCELHFSTCCFVFVVEKGGGGKQKQSTK